MQQQTQNCQLYQKIKTWHTGLTAGMDRNTTNTAVTRSQLIVIALYCISFVVAICLPSNDPAATIMVSQLISNLTLCALAAIIFLIIHLRTGDKQWALYAYTISVNTVVGQTFMWLTVLFGLTAYAAIGVTINADLLPNAVIVGAVVDVSLFALGVIGLHIYVCVKRGCCVNQNGVVTLVGTGVDRNEEQKELIAV